MLHINTFYITQKIKEPKWEPKLTYPMLTFWTTQMEHLWKASIQFKYKRYSLNIYPQLPSKKALAFDIIVGVGHSFYLFQRKIILFHNQIQTTDITTKVIYSFNFSLFT